MLTKEELKNLGTIRERWKPHTVTQPINIDAWAQPDIDTLLQLVDKLQQDAEAYERALEDYYDY